MIDEFFNVAILLFGTIVFFAWVAAMALDDVTSKNYAGLDTNRGFETLGDAVYTLFEASTTVRGATAEGGVRAFRLSMNPKHRLHV